MDKETFRKNMQDTYIEQGLQVMTESEVTEAYQEYCEERDRHY